MSADERERLEGMIRTGRGSAQMLTNARILLAADVEGPGLSDGRIVETLGTSRSSVERTRRRFVDEGLDAALARKTQEHPSRAPIFEDAAEAKLIALACSPPPKGRARWTLRLLEEKVVELAIVSQASDNTIGHTLKQTLSNGIAAGSG
ncbi:helix-turn-helix domain-containing protein [Lichenifustis flavocetrariae]|uniref:helix-turn-helix domain-containing protein n=1 Tax=Lichenifustis flavocetrariae TaxID=2949735 RepID=UPI0024A615B3|nr:helix-turn-helix domain-containing protein [Lichenifustis flavocetrariae]